MSTRRSKKTSKQTKAGAAQKGSPKAHEFKIGDRVRIIDISEELKNPQFDLKDPEMRTAELFRYCIGREFTIRGFDRYRNIELEASENATVRKKFGKFHTIWSEPKFVVLASRGRRSK